MNVKEILNEIGVHPSKELGQNFLTNEKIAERIVEAAKISDEDIVVEVGSGLGILTTFLIKKGAKLYGIEKDPKLYEFLKRKFTCGISLILGDILEINLSKLAYGKTLKIVSNIPYSITNAFLFYILKYRANIELCTITVQKEVAEKCVAQAGTKAYGPISIFLQYYADIKILFPIPANFFYPRPEVSGMLLNLKFRKPLYDLNDERLFFHIIKASFAKRRKMLKNSLGLASDRIGNIDLNRRPETLSIGEFCELANYLYLEHIRLLEKVTKS
ncbi:MAG TPA: ribosomal RNA small subunit methyltransferase A [bacterium (Candidatus Stahlbacteria)]|nr:ribosomal RNA small subunit methyltransferase A [Candidatus Stahlbacteria bacterium]